MWVLSNTVNIVINVVIVIEFIRKIKSNNFPPGSGGVDAKDSPKVKTEQTGW